VVTRGFDRGGQGGGAQQEDLCGRAVPADRRQEGAKRAAVAVAHSILVIVYHILTKHELYHDLGVTYFDERDRQAVERRLVKRLQALGYDVSLRPLTAA